MHFTQSTFGGDLWTWNYRMSWQLTYAAILVQCRTRDQNTSIESWFDFHISWSMDVRETVEVRKTVIIQQLLAINELTHSRLCKSDTEEANRYSEAINNFSWKTLVAIDGIGRSCVLFSGQSTSPFFKDEPATSTTQFPAVLCRYSVQQFGRS